jgi:TolB-like protein/DNA-binding SARP family transcriptional activator
MDLAPVASSGTEGVARWALHLLGGFTLTTIATGEPVVLTGKRERILLAFLALSHDCSAPRRKLTTLLWGESDDTASLDNLRVCLWSLRKALGDTKRQLVASRGEDMVLDIGAVDVDILTFRRLAGSLVRTELEAAANLYTGEFLDGLAIDSEEFESWRREETTRCRGQVIDVLLRLMEELARAGEVDCVIEAGLRLLRLDPFHEPAARSLMRLYAGSGRRGAAIQLYRTLGDALKGDLGVQPEAETRALLAEITAGTDSPNSAASPPPVFAIIAPDPILSAPRETVEPARPQQPIRNYRRNLFRSRTWAAAAGAAAVIIAASVFYRFAQTGSQSAPPMAPAIAAEQSAAASSISIAVLPFANLSGDPNQEFFSDGITEEITAALARIPNLSIVARTSAFQFKNPNRDVSAIGRQLHATHLIEGSVRKAGDRVRITAHLVNAVDGRQLWSEEYDRRLTDIFAIQDEIARMIAASLHKPLGLKEGENLVNNGPADTGIYDEFLRAKALWRKQPPSTVASILEKVVLRAPDYAPAWSLLALAYLSTPYGDPGLFSGGFAQWRSVMGGAIQKAGTTAHRALELDPQNADAWLALARIQQAQNNYAQAEELNARALALDPNNAGVLMNREQLLRDMGYLNQALSLSQRAVLLEPFIPNYKSRVAVDIWLNGRSDEAVKTLERLPESDMAAFFLPQLYAEQGRYTQAAEILQKREQGLFLPGTIEVSARLLRNAPARPAHFPELGQLYWVYFFVGAPEHMLDWNEEVQKLGYWASVYPLWAKPYASIRMTQRFKNYVRSLGFVEYWKQHGWPDLCHPVGADDFECD